jgi:hypothetical protein
VPKFKVPDRPSKLDPFADRISAWLKSETNKPRKQKRTLNSFIPFVLSGRGVCPGMESRLAKGAPDNGARNVRASGIRAWRMPSSRLVGGLGDRRHECTKLQVAHSSRPIRRPSSSGPISCKPTKCYSTHTIMHFRVFGGIPRRGIYDNMETAIDKVGRGKDRDVNMLFLPLSLQARVLQSGLWLGEGQVEKNVRDVRHRFFQPIPRFPSLEALNEWLETRSTPFWAETPRGKDARQDR